MKNADVLLQHFRFCLEPKAPLHMPAYNKGNVIRGGFGSVFRRIVCHGNYKDRVRDRVRWGKARHGPGDARDRDQKGDRLVLVISLLSHAVRFCHCNTEERLSHEEGFHDEGA